MEENIVTSVDETMAPAEESFAVEAPKKTRKPINQQKLQDNIWGWAFCVPLIIGTVWFVYFAFVLALLISFTNYSANAPDSLMEAVFNLGAYVDPEEGPLVWYKYLFTHKAGVNATFERRGFVMNEMGMYLFNTVFYMIGIPIGMVLSMFFAVCMSRDIRGGNLFRVLYYLPCVASSIAIVYTFKILFKPLGVMNNIFGLDDFTGASSTGFRWLAVAPDAGYSWQTLLDLGESATNNKFLADPFWCQGLFTKLVIIIMSVWKGLGGTIILYVAGLSGVNAATKEAAQIDGADGWQIFWKVTMPDLYPVIFYNIVTSVIGGLQIYAEPELLLSGDASSAGFPLASGYVALIYKYGLTDGQQYKYGQGAAYGFFLAIIIFVLTLFQFWLDSRNKD